LDLAHFGLYWVHFGLWEKYLVHFGLWEKYLVQGLHKARALIMVGELAHFTPLGLECKCFAFARLVLLASSLRLKGDE
jgi:hypothetical protein